MTTVSWPCQNCGEATPRRFPVACSNCDKTIYVCADCVNANPQHDECPEEEN